MIEKLIDPGFYYNIFVQIKDWSLINIFVMENFLQLSLQIFILLVSRGGGEIVGRWCKKTLAGRLTDFKITEYRMVSNLLNKTIHFIPLLVSIFILWICIKVMSNADSKTFLLVLMLNLSMAWVVIQIVTSVIVDQFRRRIIAILAWLFAVLNIIGLLNETVLLLESIGFTIGKLHLNLLSVLKAMILLIVLFKLVRWLSDYLEKSLEKFSGLTPSSRLIIAKTINILLLFIAALIGLNTIGIDLTTFAVFSGAIGFGVGFGLQKVVSNFVSGLILLFDKTIKPGDVIEIEDVYGWVKHMGGRCISVITRDEKEYLIPNEDLMTRQVINWSYTSNRIRIKANLGISYAADVHKTRQLIVDAIKELDRILTQPSPKCLLTGFGDNSVELQLRFWIKDPHNGVANITSDALLKVWDALKEHNIEIPFPQRDVHLNLNEGTNIVLSREN